jgi:hypothetical protein
MGKSGEKNPGLFQKNSLAFLESKESKLIFGTQIKM